MRLAMLSMLPSDEASLVFRWCTAMSLVQLSTTSKLFTASCKAQAALMLAELWQLAGQTTSLAARATGAHTMLVLARLCDRRVKVPHSFARTVSDVIEKYCGPCVGRTPKNLKFMSMLGLQLLWLVFTEEPDPEMGWEHKLPCWLSDIFAEVVRACCVIADPYDNSGADCYTGQCINVDHVVLGLSHAFGVSCGGRRSLTRKLECAAEDDSEPDYKPPTVEPADVDVPGYCSMEFGAAWHPDVTAFIEERWESITSRATMIIGGVECEEGEYCTYKFCNRCHDAYCCHDCGCRPAANIFAEARRRASGFEERVVAARAAAKAADWRSTEAASWREELDTAEEAWEAAVDSEAYALLSEIPPTECERVLRLRQVRADEQKLLFLARADPRAALKQIRDDYGEWLSDSDVATFLGPPRHSFLEPGQLC